MLFVFFLGLAGFALVFVIHDNFIAGQIVIAVAFSINLLVIFGRFVSRTRERVRKYVAAFVVGALGAILFA
jgi:hypothetical protein